MKSPQELDEELNSLINNAYKELMDSREEHLEKVIYRAKQRLRNDWNFSSSYYENLLESLSITETVFPLVQEEDMKMMSITKNELMDFIQEAFVLKPAKVSIQLFSDALEKVYLKDYKYSLNKSINIRVIDTLETFKELQFLQLI